MPYRPSTEQRQRLTELATVFLRLGTIAFGGPAAHVAMMDQEVVSRRQWMSREKLLDLFGITNLIPGPNSTELAMHIGYDRGGWPGLLVAGSCFIFPAMTIVWILAAVYVRYQTVPQLQGLLYGIKPVMIAIVLQALWSLGQKAAKDIPTILAGVVAAGAYLAGGNELLLLVLLGVGVMLIKNWRPRGHFMGGFVATDVSTVVGTVAAGTVDVGMMDGGTTTASISWLSVWLFFLKIGCVLYGSGYVLLAFLQRDLVERQQWLTSQQLLDAVAIGQLTPGPVLTTATFVGYLLAGNAGAIAATVGIFLPAFGLVGPINPWVPRLRRSVWISSFLDGVNAASLGLMVGVTYTLGRTALIDGLTIGLTILSTIALGRFQVNSVWLVLIGGLIGGAVQLWRSVG